jgi:predicted nuclease of predicted toxin-antitoxin system
MRIVLDENLPRPLKQVFGSAHSVTTVQELGLAGVANGELLARLEGQFDVFVTADKNLQYQQRLVGRSLSILELPTNRLPALMGMIPRIVSALESAMPGEYQTLPFEAVSENDQSGEDP